MKWDYDEMLEASQHKEDRRYEIAKVYIETHDKNGPRRNVSKWYDFCNIKGINPFDSEKPMPENITEYNVLEYQEREEELATRRKYGKGGKKDIHTRNDKMLANDWHKSARDRWFNMSEDDRRDVEMKLKGNQRVEERAMIKNTVEDFREAFRKTLDFKAVKEKVMGANLKTIPSKKHKPVRLRMISKVKKKLGILSQKLYETSLPILDMERANEVELRNLTDRILSNTPSVEREPDYRTEERREDRRVFVSLEQEEKERKDKDRFGR